MSRTLLPVVLGVLAALGVALLVMPFAGLLAATPWGRLGAALAGDNVLAALRLSLASSIGALALATAFGVPLAWVLARRSFPGKALVRALCVLPMVLPPVVGGVALLLAFGRRGLVGAPLERLTGLVIPFSPAATVLAAAFVAMPFLILTVEAGLRAADRRLEEVASTLGASRWTVFRRVTVPLVGPSLGAGMGLCWARALGEFGATITFAGNLPGRTQTMPLAVYVALESDLGAAVVMSLLLAAISVAVLVALRGRFLSS